MFLYDISEIAKSDGELKIRFAQVIKQSGCSSRDDYGYIDYLCIRAINATNVTKITKVKKTKAGCLIESKWNRHEWYALGVSLIPSTLLTKVFNYPFFCSFSRFFGNFEKVDYFAILAIIWCLKSTTVNKRTWGENKITIGTTSYGVASIFGIFASTVYVASRYEKCYPDLITKIS